MNRLIYGFVIVAVLLITGTLYFHRNESWSYVDSFYFSAVTVTTVGYGDLHPQKDSTKIFISFYSIFGISAMLYVLGSVIGKHVEDQEKHFRRLLLGIYNLRPSIGLMDRRRLNRALTRNLIKRRKLNLKERWNHGGI